MTRDVVAAIRKLDEACEQIELDASYSYFVRCHALFILYRAIHHIARPERDVYPKTRKGTKSKPVTNQHIVGCACSTCSRKVNNEKRDR